MKHTSNYTNRTSTWRDFYEAGYNTGYAWMGNYLPGGPYCTRDPHRYPDSTRRDRENAQLWFMGFNKGVKQSNIKTFKRLKAA